MATLVKRPDKPNQQPLTIEVVSGVNGLTDADLDINTVVQLDDKLEYRIPAPPVLLKAKIYNLISLVADERPQDLKHTRMLMRIVPQYLNELFAEFRAGRIAEANLLGAVNYTRAVVLASFAENAARPHTLDFREVFPQSLRLSGPQPVREVIEETDRRLIAIYGFPPSTPP